MPWIPTGDNVWGVVTEITPKSILHLPNQKRKVTRTLEIKGIGPACKYVALGDTAIIPYGGGGDMIELLDMETLETEQVFCISESLIPIIYRDGDDGDSS